jgi:tetratricopeptide (TPR) repeat protein
MTEAAISQIELGNLSEAFRSLAEAQQLLVHPDGRMHPDLVDVLVGLGKANMRQRRFAEALPLLEKADAFWRDFDPANHWANQASLLVAQCRRALKRS